MIDIDSGELEYEPGDGDRRESPEPPDGPDLTDGFALNPVPDSLPESALARVRVVLGSETAVEDLEAYYDTGGDYAGRTFLDAADVAANEFTAADLFSVSLLQVSVRPRAARVFLDPGPEHDALIAALRAVCTDVESAVAEPPTYSAMASVYTGCPM